MGEEISSIFCILLPRGVPHGLIHPDLLLEEGEGERLDKGRQIRAVHVYTGADPFLPMKTKEDIREAVRQPLLLHAGPLREEAELIEDCQAKGSAAERGPGGSPSRSAPQLPRLRLLLRRIL